MLLALALRIERVLFRPILSGLMKPFDVGLELRAINPPHAAAPDLDRGEVSRADESVDLRPADVQEIRYIFEGHKARLDRTSTGSGHSITTRGRTHTRNLAPVGVRYLALGSFALDCSRPRQVGA